MKFCHFRKTEALSLLGRRSGALAAFFSLLACALTSSCNVIPTAQSDPTRFYVLTSPTPAATPGEITPTGHLRLGLRTVELAQYLRGNEVVVRSGANELQMQDYARWGEPLQAGITRVLREQIAVAPAVAEVQSQPFSLASDRDYDIAVTVLHCEGSSSRHAAEFEAVIQIATAGPSPRPVLRKLFTAPPAHWDGRDFGELAALLSQDVAELGRQIIASLPAS